MSYSTRTMNDEDWKRLKYFQKEEFAKPEVMGYEFMNWLDGLRSMAGVQMIVSSSYRTPEHNKAVGGASDSAHCDIPCESVDIRKHPNDKDRNWNYARYQIISTALVLGCKRIGMYPNGSLHLDKSDSRPQKRIWIHV